MPKIAIKGTELYYEDIGTGPSVLFIHGMCGNASVWSEQARRLGSNFRCVTYDRRGHTRSPLAAIQQRTVQVHADDAAALIQALRLEPCSIIGSSSGARIALDVVRRYPHLIRGAVLSEPPLLALDPEGGAGLIGELKPQLDEAIATGGPRAAVDAFFQHVCPGLWQVIDEGRRDKYRDNAGELFGDLRMPSYQVTMDDLRAINVDCLVVSGGRSHPVMKGIAGMLAEGIPGAELLELADSGHVTYFEQPEAFARAVTQFIMRVNRQAAPV